MANHGYVKTKRKLTRDEVTKALKEINERRFKGLFDLSGPTPFQENKREFCWSFRFKQDDWLYFEVWKKEGAKTLEFRHPHGSFNFWAQCVVENDLALKFNGLITDDGCGDKWRGEKNKYPTFYDYEYNSWFGYPKAKKGYRLQAFKLAFADQVEQLPAELRPLIGKNFGAKELKKAQGLFEKMVAEENAKEKAKAEAKRADKNAIPTTPPTPR